MSNNAETKTDAGTQELRAVALRGGAAGDHTAVVATDAVSETSALISMIERAARDPSVDLDKMERLLAMKERASAEAARRAYFSAFAAMQADMPEIEKRGRIIITDKSNKEKVIQSTPYALWDDVNAIIKPILAAHGFSLSFRIAQTDAKITTIAVLAHVGGHCEETSFSASIDNTGSKNNVQGWGSSFSYGKRYTGTAILNITTRGEDDDGRAAGLLEETKHTADDLRAKIAEAKASEAWFCNHYSVETLDDLTGNQLSEAIAGLSARINKAKLGR